MAGVTAASTVKQPQPPKEVTIGIATRWVASWLLSHQELLRDGDRLDGRMGADEFALHRGDGNKVPLTAGLMKRHGLDQCFILETTPEGDKAIRVKDSILSGNILKGERQRLARNLVEFVKSSGFTLDLRSNENQSHISIAHSQNEGAKATFAISIGDCQIDGADHLDVHQDERIMANGQSFGQYMQDLQRMPLKTAKNRLTFEKKLQILRQQYLADKESKIISKDMSFFHYRLQFIDFMVDAEARWTNGDQRMDLLEWFSLFQVVNDLPEKHQWYHWVDLSWPDPATGQLIESNRLVALDIDLSKLPKHRRVKAFEEGVKRAIDWTKTGVSIKEAGVAHEVYGREEVMPDLFELSQHSSALLLCDDAGKVDWQKALDPQQLPKLVREKMAEACKAAEYTVLTMMQENSGEVFKDLFTPVPITDRATIRQSNGRANYITIGTKKICLINVNRLGNDPGAYGICAPNSQEQSAKYALTNAAYNAMKILKCASSNSIVEAANDYFSLLFSKHTQENRARLSAALKELTKTVSAKGSPNEKAAIFFVGLFHERLVEPLVVKVDADGACFEFRAEVPYAANSYDGYLVAGDRTVKLRLADFVKYLGETLQDIGGRLHPKSLYENPSALNRAEANMFAGLAMLTGVGLDLLLKASNKESGNCFGPSNAVSSQLVLNRAVKVTNYDLKKPGSFDHSNQAAWRKGVDENIEFFGRTLKDVYRRGGGFTFTLGYNGGTFHVNPGHKVGEPIINGVAIPATVIGRLHMNYRELPEMPSAWQSDRVYRYGVNTGSTQRSLEEIKELLTADAKKRGESFEDPALDAAIECAKAATEKLATLARSKLNLPRTTPSEEAIASLWDSNHWGKVVQNKAYLALARKSSGDSMRWLYNNWELDCSESADVKNFVLVAANTERSNYTTDLESDRSAMGSGIVGDTSVGSWNACDGSYVIPLEVLVRGWNGEDGEATRVTLGPAAEAKLQKAKGPKALLEIIANQFPMVSSISIMYPIDGPVMELIGPRRSSST